MITKNQLKTAQTYCKAIAKLRALGRCEMRCQKEATEGHHIFFGRWRNYWQLMVNENFYVAMCDHHHRHDKYCPHRNIERWWDIIKAEKHKEIPQKRLCTIPPERVAVMLCQRARLYSQKFLTNQQCDGEAELARLNQEFKKCQNIYETDIYACQVAE